MEISYIKPCVIRRTVTGLAKNKRNIDTRKFYWYVEDDYPISIENCKYWQGNEGFLYTNYDFKKCVIRHTKKGKWQATWVCNYNPSSSVNNILNYHACVKDSIFFDHKLQSKLRKKRKYKDNRLNTKSVPTVNDLNTKSVPTVNDLNTKSVPNITPNVFKRVCDTIASIIGRSKKKTCIPQFNK